MPEGSLESLTGIAESYGVSMRDLVVWNGLSDARLSAGQELILYMKTSAKAAPSPPPRIADESGEKRHRVRPGETLHKIARQYGTSPQYLVELNGLRDPNHIWVGQRLKVP